MNREEVPDNDRTVVMNKSTVDEMTKIITQLESDKLEMAKAIVEEYRKEADYDFNAECNFCGAEESYKNNYTITHTEDCIVNKALKYIKEVSK